MDDSYKPRHIRDIAHLYLSRLPTGGVRDRRRVLIVAASRECFGGYHAANLALGVARKGVDVEVVEVSGVLPCSAYFLRMPPRVYLKHKAQSPGEPVSALGGVTVRFARDDRAEATRPVRMEVVHLPPATDAEALDGELAQTIGGGGAVRAVVLAPDESLARETGRRVFARRPEIEWMTLSLERRITAAERSRGAGRSLGYLVGWRRLLTDPVPCVLRDPESHVSRSYLAVCNVLVSPARFSKERDGAKSARGRASLGQIR